MRQKYRSELDLAICIMNSIKNKGDGIIGSQIAREINLSYNRVIEIKADLISQSLVFKRITRERYGRGVSGKIRNTFLLTENGGLFLKEAERFKELLHKFNLVMTL